MYLIFVVLILLLAVTISGTLARLLPVPLPLIQIGLGTLLAIGPLPSIDLNSEVFFLVLLPPLLFLDGWRIPKQNLRRDARLILALALGLVVATVLGMGFFIHWLIPAMPLAVAFALAAVLAPTDPIAVSAVAARVPIPERLMHILEGESLLNDASGLVCLRFAIGAALTGTFSLPSAIATFLWLALAGVAIGVGLTVAITFLQDRILSRVGEDPGTQTIVSILIPFAAYLGAEAVEASGILAVVAAGITMSFVENQGRALALTRMRRSAVWDTIQLAVNGVIFVLLGEQLPGIFERAREFALAEGEFGYAWLIVYAIVITLALAVLRFVWVWIAVEIALRKRGGDRRAGFRLRLGLVAATSLGGVKGAVTLAGILTLPFFMGDGSAFPARELAIFLAMAVILVSLVAASVLMPTVLRRTSLPPSDRDETEELRARQISGSAARDAIYELRDSLARSAGDPDLYNEAAQRAIERYQFAEETDEENLARGREMFQAERRLRLAGLRAERDALFSLRRDQAMEEALLTRLTREVDLLEARFVEG